MEESPSKLAEKQALFNYYDHNKDGFIDFYELSIESEELSLPSIFTNSPSQLHLGNATALTHRFNRHRLWNVNYFHHKQRISTSNNLLRNRPKKPRQQSNPHKPHLQHRPPALQRRDLLRGHDQPEARHHLLLHRYPSPPNLKWATTRESSPTHANSNRFRKTSTSRTEK